MSRANNLIRRVIRRSPTRTSLSSTSSWAAFSTEASSDRVLTRSVIGAAAAVLGIGLVAKISCTEDRLEIAQCEAVDETSHGKTTLKTISSYQLKDTEYADEGKSERAFVSARSNGLFNSYEDGADDWVEVQDENIKTIPTEESIGVSDSTNNAVTEKFVSPVNLQPQISIRHTNRSAETQLQPSTVMLATSTESVKAESDSSVDPSVILRKITTISQDDLFRNQVYTKSMYFYRSDNIKSYMKEKFRLFALPSSENMGKEMGAFLETDLNVINVGAFTDGETSVKINDTCRGKYAYVVCATTSSQSIMELLLTISALRRGSAKRICAVIPYYGYSRQDRRTNMKREPIAAADMSVLLEEMGVDSVICCDLHNPLLKGFFSPTVPVDHLMPGPVAAAYFYEELMEGAKKTKEAPKITIVAAHENHVFRANVFRNALVKLSGSDDNDIRVALVSNTTARKWESSSLVGDVQGRTCIIVDDIINTGGTMRNAIRMVSDAGAESVYAWATHGVLHLPENDAPEKIKELDCLKYLLISNSVTIDRELPSKIRQLSIAPLLAEAVVRAFHNDSITSIFRPPDSDK